MVSKRLHIDPAGRAITAIAAASGEAALTQTTVAARVQHVAAIGHGGNGFDLEVAAARIWASGVYETVAIAVGKRCTAVRAASVSGFNALDAMNEENAVTLNSVAE